MSARPTATLLAAAALGVRAAGCAAAPAAAVPSLPHLDAQTSLLVVAPHPERGLRVEVRQARHADLDAQTSLLVVAPHPDDETLCCAGVIQRVVRAGGRARS